MILDVVWRYLSLFVLYIDIEIGKTRTVRKSIASVFDEKFRERKKKE